MDVPFPYTKRTYQDEMLAQVGNVTTGRSKHLIIESGTGTGKTVCALAPLVAAVQGRDRKVLYTTRTNSQQHQVLRELRTIADHMRRTGSGPKGILGISIQGRANCCPMKGIHTSWQNGSIHELSVLCSDMKRASRKGDGSGCPFFSRLMGMDLTAIEARIARELPTMEELGVWCRELGICPYELSKILASKADVVVVPYIYLFQTEVRHRFLDWIGMSMDELFVVVDEAHNLADYLRNLMSDAVSVETLERAMAEAVGIQDPKLVDDLTITTMCRTVIEVIRYLESEYMIEDDGLVPPDMFEAEIMSRLRISSPRLMTVVKEMTLHGQMVQDIRRKNGQLPRSYIHAVGRFLTIWQGMDCAEYIRLIARDPESTWLEAYCLDPGIAGELLSKSAGTVHISGTLMPLEEYRDTVGLPGDTVMKRFPSPFPRANRLICYDPVLTTQYEHLLRDPGMVPRLAKGLSDICASQRRNTAVFFPSFELMGQVLDQGPIRELDRERFVERRGDQRALMETIGAFRRMGQAGGRGAVLFSVIGGRVSEGMDFPENELEVAVIVGIPYPKPTSKIKALRYYYDQRYGKGWEYVIHAPTMRKLMQTIGRLIRTETDKGVAVILDRRAVNFQEHLEGMVRCEDHVHAISEFFER